jgi:hypothetical protein
VYIGGRIFFTTFPNGLDFFGPINYGLRAINWSDLWSVDDATFSSDEFINRERAALRDLLCTHESLQRYFETAHVTL